MTGTLRGAVRQALPPAMVIALIGVAWLQWLLWPITGHGAGAALAVEHWVRDALLATGPVVVGLTCTRLAQRGLPARSTARRILVDAVVGAVALAAASPAHQLLLEGHQVIGVGPGAIEHAIDVLFVVSPVTLLAAAVWYAFVPGRETAGVTADRPGGR